VDGLGHYVAILSQDFTEEGVELGCRFDNEPAGPCGRPPSQLAVRQARHVCRWLPFIAVRGFDRDVAGLGQDAAKKVWKEGSGWTMNRRAIGDSSAHNLVSMAVCKQDAGKIVAVAAFAPPLSPG